MPSWDADKLHGFEQSAASLKLYRRADLSDPEHRIPLIDELYVDPLPDEAVFKTILRPSTTFLVGRKGSGKSTIFQRLQSELRRTKHQTSAYVDIKTVFESSQVDPQLLERLGKLTNSLPSPALERLLLYKEFLKSVVAEIKAELRRRVESSLWERVKEKVTGSISELFEGLDAVLEESNEDRFVSALGIKTTEVKTKQAASSETSSSLEAGLKVSAAPSASVAGKIATTATTSNDQEKGYGELLLRSFDIKGLISRLRTLLEALGIRHLYVLVDDFSELPEEPMRVVVDALLAPLNNWSDEFVKFKIAAYPGRIYFGEIDKTKIDEIYLDLYKLYGSGDVGRMEASGIDFTRRLVTARIDHYCSVNPNVFFEGNEEDVWRELFFASMANPRILGYILHFLYESRLIQGRGIGVRAVQEAASRYFEEKIETYFHLGKFLHESFSERSSIYSLKELLESVVNRARDLRSHDSEVMRKIPGRPPTSHFHVPVAYEQIFSTLELNFFLTKYFEMSDRSGRKVSVFALNYGLCAKYDIRFGRPVGEREFRLYLVERFFDYSPLVLAYLTKNQEILCDNASCGERFGYEQLEAIQMFGMLCPTCRSGTVRVKNLSQKYAAELEAVHDDLLLPTTELGILQTLHVENRPMRPAAIAGELDCSYQLIGKRGVVLSDRGLVKRYQNEQGQRLLEISPTAESTYFTDTLKDSLDVPQDPTAKPNS
jgi:DNA-binding MarR family transcriptional regulator